MNRFYGLETDLQVESYLASGLKKLPIVWKRGEWLAMQRKQE